MSENTAATSLSNSGAEDRLKGHVATETLGSQPPIASPEAVDAYLVIDGRPGGSSSESSQKQSEPPPKK